MEHVHHKPIEVIGMIWQQFSSNENTKLMLSANALCSTEISTYWTQQYNSRYTLLQFITRPRLTLIDSITNWRRVKSLWYKLLLCTICRLKFAFHTSTPGRLRQFCQEFSSPPRVNNHIPDIIESSERNPIRPSLHHVRVSPFWRSPGCCCRREGRTAPWPKRSTAITARHFLSAKKQTKQNISAAIWPGWIGSEARPFSPAICGELDADWRENGAPTRTGARIPPGRTRFEENDFLFIRNRFGRERTTAPAIPSSGENARRFSRFPGSLRFFTVLGIAFMILSGKNVVEYRVRFRIRRLDEFSFNSSE